MYLLIGTVDIYPQGLLVPSSSTGLISAGPSLAKCLIKCESESTDTNIDDILLLVQEHHSGVFFGLTAILQISLTSIFDTNSLAEHGVLEALSAKRLFL
jgi:hypothetical protein